MEKGADGGELLPRSAAASDEELERGILDALRLGLVSTAEALTVQLRERQRARAGNVVDYAFERQRRERGA